MPWPLASVEVHHKIWSLVLSLLVNLIKFRFHYCFFLLLNLKAKILSAQILYIYETDPLGFRTNKWRNTVSMM